MLGWGPLWERRSRDPFLHTRDVADWIGTDGLHVEQGHARGFERGDALLNIAFGADQRERLEQRIRHKCLGFTLLAREIQVLDLRRLALEPVAGDQLVVEVLRAR